MQLARLECLKTHSAVVLWSQRLRRLPPTGAAGAAGCGRPDALVGLPASIACCASSSACFFWLTMFCSQTKKQP